MQQHVVNLVYPVPILKPSMDTLNSAFEVPTHSIESFSEEQDDYKNNSLRNGQNVDTMVV